MLSLIFVKEKVNKKEGKYVVFKVALNNNNVLEIMNWQNINEIAN